MSRGAWHGIDDLDGEESLCRLLPSFAPASPQSAIPSME